MKKLLSILIVCTMATMVVAQEVKFKASAPAQVIMGKPFQLVYQVNQRAKDLRVPEFTNFDYIAGPSPLHSPTTSVVYGRRTSISTLTYTYTYTLMANQEGNFTIQPATIMVDGKQYTSNGVRITVLPPDKTPTATTDNSSTGNASSIFTRTIKAQEFKIGKLTFEITSSNTVELSNADNDITKVFLGETVDYQGKTYTLTSIGDDAFSSCTSLTSVTIPNSVTWIGSKAFVACKSLTSVIILNSETSIGWDAFYGTALYNNPANWDNGALYVNDCLIEVDTSFVGNFKIKENTHLIADGAFSQCSSLTSVTIPNSVTSIGRYAFSGCTSLTTVTIPNSVTHIGERAFDGCSALTSVTIPNSVTSIGRYAFYGCSSLTSVTIPNSVTWIGDETFYGCSSLTSVTIPNSVTSIGWYAFYGCSSLTSVTIPSSVTEIEQEAFEGCSSLTSVTIPNSVELIGWRAFLDCKSLKSVTIPNGVTHIMGKAFSGCTSLTSITIPNSVTWIGSEAFEGTALYNNPANWDNGALYIDNCLLKVDTSFVGNFKIKENTRLIANGAFFYCTSLTSVTIPNSVTGIGNVAFEGCKSLTSVTIPNSVTCIGDGAFSGCTSLTSVTIPNSVTCIGDGAFSGCSSLTSITVDAGNTHYDSRNNCNAIIETETNTLIAGCKNTTIPNSVTEIGTGAFSGCTSLTSVTIPNSVTEIEAGAFSGCSSLKSVTIPNSVTSIGWVAFSGCSSLKSVTIPNSVTSIGDGAFWDCESLTSVTIPESVKWIGDEAFGGCESLTSINYTGTMEQWHAIDKHYLWNYDTPATHVQCTDGKVEL